MWLPQVSEVGLLVSHEESGSESVRTIDLENLHMQKNINNTKNFMKIKNTSRVEHSKVAFTKRIKCIIHYRP